MALRLRRGTDAQRQLITPAQGELIYVTDTTELYVGDGTTLGGVRITGEVVNQLAQLNDVDAALPQDGDVLSYDSATGDWVAGELPLGDLSDVNADGILDGQILAWDSASSAFIPANNIGGGATTFVGELRGSVFGDDSKLLVDGVNSTIPGDVISGTITADLEGDVTGTLTGRVAGDVTGTFTGDIYSSDSSIMLDANKRTAYVRRIDSATTLFLEGNTATFLTSNSGFVNIGGTDPDGAGSHRNVGLVIDREASAATGLITSHFNNSSSRMSDLKGVKYRGTIASPASINVGDTLLEISGEGYDGTTEKAGGVIDIVTEGAPGASLIPSKIRLRVGNSSGGITNFVGDSNGVWTAPSLSITNNATIGGTIDGDLVGSIFADNSTQVIDGTTGTIVNLDFRGETGNTPATPGSVDSWLEVTVNGASKYIPLYD